MSPMRIGFVGLGHNGMAHIQAHVRLGKSVPYAACDVNPRRLQAAREKFGIERLYEGPEIFSDPNVDAISIHTGDPQHEAPFIQAVAHGKHVLVEKPVANRMAQLDAMVDAARQAGRGLKIQCGYVLRFDPFFEAVHALCRGGALGRIFYMEADYVHNLVYQKNQTDAVTGRNWYLEEEQPIVGGGSHELDLLRWFSAREVVEVAGYANHFAFPEMKNDDCQVALFRFDDGTISKVAAAYGPVTARPVCANLRLYGTRGTIDRDAAAIGANAEDVHPEYKPIAAPPVTGHPFEPEIADWLDAIAQDRPTRCGICDGANSTAATLKAVEAMKAGRAMRVPVYED